jgi:hypothetical protein
VSAARTVIVDDPAESPYPLAEPPDGLKGAFLSGELVQAKFSGVVYINMQTEWATWKVRLEKIARERGVRIGIKAWLDPNASADDAYAQSTRGEFDPVQPDATRALVIVQLQVDDPELPDAHRVKTYQATANWPQRAIWHTLHAAGLVLERELP